MGIDTIELGATIGVLNDVGLFDFGDAARAEALPPTNAVFDVPQEDIEGVFRF